MIIGLTSPAPRCGKDTCADFLVQQYGFYKDSFGRGIYLQASAAFGVTVEQLALHEWKTQPQNDLSLFNCKDEEFVGAVLAGGDGGDYDSFLYQPRTSRFVLQQWGTEYRRKEDELYWVKDTKKRVDDVILNSERSIVISDVREMHEVAYLYELAAASGQKLALVEISRESAMQFKTNHTSDAGIPVKYLTHRIENVENYTGTMLTSLVMIVNELRSNY